MANVPIHSGSSSIREDLLSGGDGALAQYFNQEPNYEGEIAMNRRITKSLLVVGVALLGITMGTTFAQTDRDNSASAGVMKILEDLLSEVHQLRKTVQENRLDAYRGLMVVERLRLQQERVDRLSRQLDELRLDLTNMETHLPEMQDRVKNFESQVEGEQEAIRKSQLESELKAFRSLLDQQLAQRQLLQEREGQLNVQLQTEQAKLDDLNQKLISYEGESKQ